MSFRTSHAGKAALAGGERQFYCPLAVPNMGGIFPPL